jgi:hypothetical protein
MIKGSGWRKREIAPGLRRRTVTEALLNWG